MPRRRKAKYQLSLGLSDADSLDELRQDTDASSRSEVVREAIGIYRYCIDEAKKGGVIAIQHADGSTAQVAFRGIETVRRAFSSEANNLRKLPGDPEAEIADSDGN